MPDSTLITPEPYDALPGSPSRRTDANPVEATPVVVRRIRFVEQPPAGATMLAEFVDPYRRQAVAETLDAATFFASPVRAAHADELDLVTLPAGSATPYQWQQKVEAWMSTPGPQPEPPILDVTLRSDRVLWRAGRAIVIAGPESGSEMLAGLLDFAFHEGELRKLERELAEDWPTAEADIELTHGVGRRQLPRRDHVNRMTHITTLRRMRFARLEPHLEKASATLPGQARRLVSELTLQAEATDRLGYLDDRLEVYEDLYELANDRLSEFSYFFKEFWLEVGIVVLLIAEVVIMILELRSLWAAE